MISLNWSETARGKTNACENKSWPCLWTYHSKTPLLLVLTKLRNKMVSRMVINLLIMCVLKLCWVIEQPASSLLEHHPLFAWLCKHFKIYRVSSLQAINAHLQNYLEIITSHASPYCNLAKAFIWMGSYGGCSDLPNESGKSHLKPIANKKSGCTKSCSSWYGKNPIK